MFIITVLSLFLITAKIVTHDSAGALSRSAQLKSCTHQINNLIDISSKRLVSRRYFKTIPYCLRANRSSDPVFRERSATTVGTGTIRKFSSCCIIDIILFTRTLIAFPAIHRYRARRKINAAYESKGTAMATKSKIARREVPPSGPRRQTQITRALKIMILPLAENALSLLCFYTTAKTSRRKNKSLRHRDYFLPTFASVTDCETAQIGDTHVLYRFFVELKQSYTTQNA